MQTPHLVVKLEDMAKTKPKKRKTKPKEAEKELTVKQQKFIDAYDGDIQTASNAAGISYVYGRTLYTKAYILDKIKHRQDTEVRPAGIMNRLERQKFWSDAAQNKKIKWRDRLRASELLGKSEADFVEVHLDVKKSVLSPEDAQAIIDENEKRFGKEENER